MMKSCLAQFNFFGKAANRFSSRGPVRYVDLRDGAKVARSYREVGPNEDVGALKAIHSVQVQVKNNILFDQNKGVVGISILYI